MNVRELLYLARQHSISEGMPIDSDADVEMAVNYCGQCNHVVITVNNDLWVNGYLVSACRTPDRIHYINQHADLTADAIKELHKKFERMKNC